MGVLLQAAYRRRKGDSVPSPADGNAAIPWWWDHLADQANALRLSGFTAVLLPPVVKTCFVPNVPRDPIAGPVQFDFGFGDELAPVNARPPGYVMHGLIDAGDWMTHALDVQGYRVDDVKGLSVEFVGRWLRSKAMATRFGVGEYFDGNRSTLNWWVWESGMMGRCNVFDF